MATCPRAATPTSRPMAAGTTTSPIRSPSLPPAPTTGCGTRRRLAKRRAVAGVLAPELHRPRQRGEGRRRTADAELVAVHLLLTPALLLPSGQPQRVLRQRGEVLERLELLGV